MEDGVLAQETQAAAVQGNRARLAWSIDDLATALGVCRDRIYADIRAGKLVARRIGVRRTIVTDDEARRYLNGLVPIKLPAVRVRRAINAL